MATIYGTQSDFREKGNWGDTIAELFRRLSLQASRGWQPAVMLRAMTRKSLKKPNVAIVGAGRLGSALAVSLRRVGYRVREVVSRAKPASGRRAQLLAKRVGARVVAIGKDPIHSEVVWLCVPDRGIRGCAEALARSGEWKDKVVFHSSGALSSGELRALQTRGAAVASVHPMMTFVAGVTPPLVGVGFALEGDSEAVRVARRIVRALGGDAFRIAKKDKSLYHAWGTFASPLFTALLAISEQVAGAAGITGPRARRWTAPIVRQTLENYATRGAARGVSGPIVRGDAATVKEHLRVLRGLSRANDVYRALASASLQVIPARNKKQLKMLLQ